MKTVKTKSLNNMMHTLQNAYGKKRSFISIAIHEPQPSNRSHSTTTEWHQLGTLVERMTSATQPKVKLKLCFSVTGECFDLTEVEEAHFC
jgi:hypothetical protein